MSEDSYKKIDEYLELYEEALRREDLEEARTLNQELYEAVFAKLLQLKEKRRELENRANAAEKDLVEFINSSITSVRSIRRIIKSRMSHAQQNSQGGKNGIPIWSFVVA